jgi:hypothetical protein
MMAQCIAKIKVDSSTSNKDETIAIFSEALLHLMLTVCTLSSERKRNSPFIVIILYEFSSSKSEIETLESPESFFCSDYQNRSHQTMQD